MASTVLRCAVGVVTFIALDGLWLGVLMKDFYRQQLAPIVRLANGAMAPNWTAALVVYLALGAGIGVFVVPRATTLATAAGYGALFGLIVYGVYDFTNYSTLKDWTMAVTLADVAWGGVASAVCAMVVWLVAR